MDLQFAPTGCGPTGDSVATCHKMGPVAPEPESTEKLETDLCVMKKIKFFSGWKDIAVADAGTMGGGGVQQG
jgi:hypothetical protein